jgi:hypothetical protein
MEPTHLSLLAMGCAAFVTNRTNHNKLVHVNVFIIQENVNNVMYFLLLTNNLFLSYELQKYEMILNLFKNINKN